MAQSVPNPPPGFDNLRVDEKIEYVLSLWQKIAARPEQVPVPQWHLDGARERLKRHREDPDAARPWSEVRAELDRKYGSR